MKIIKKRIGGVCVKCGRSVVERMGSTYHKDGEFDDCRFAIAEGEMTVAYQEVVGEHGNTEVTKGIHVETTEIDSVRTENGWLEVARRVGDARIVRSQITIRTGELFGLLNEKALRNKNRTTRLQGGAVSIEIR